MRDHDVEALLVRYQDLQANSSFEDWRRLSQDVLAALVQQQGLVIALQRRALDSHRYPSEERSSLRARAEAAFALVQQLHQLRRKVHALLSMRAPIDPYATPLARPRSPARHRLAALDHGLRNRPVTRWVVRRSA
jgi:hypothetical protein